MQSLLPRSVTVGPWSVLVLAKSIAVSEQDLRSGMGSATASILAQSTHDSRIQEVLRSRWLLRSAYGLTDPGRGVEGELLWHEDVCGSLSHKNGHVAVLSLPRGTYRSVGLDMEQIEVPERVANRVLTSEERSRMAGLGAPREIGAAGFAAKESIFKAVFPFGRERFWFEDATIEGVSHPDVANQDSFQLSVRIGPRAGGPLSWDRSCVIDMTRVTLDDEIYWLAVCAIADA